MRFFWLVVLLSGCQKPFPPPVPPTAPDMMPVCTAMPDPPQVCDGLFTVDGLACALCSQKGCFDSQDVIYCVEATCLDKRCSAAMESARQHPVGRRVRK